VTPKTPTTVEEILRENLRLKATQPPVSGTTLYVVSIIVLCALTAVFVLLITIIRPTEDNTVLILSVTGIVVPVVTALLAGAVQRLHSAVNGRLSELLELTAIAARADGALEIRRKIARAEHHAPPHSREEADHDPRR
jgi:hypothetical protein